MQVFAELSHWLEIGSEKRLGFQDDMRCEHIFLKSIFGGLRPWRYQNLNSSWYVTEQL